MTIYNNSPSANTSIELLEALQRIAALEQTVDVLQTQVRSYTQALDFVKDMVLIKGSASRIVYGNKAFRDHYGMTAEELSDLVDAPFNNPDYTQQYIQDDAYVFTTGQTLDIPQEPVTRSDGVVRLFHTVKAAIRNNAGTIIQTVGVSRNITEEVSASAALQSSEERFVRMVANVPGMVYQFVLTPDRQASFPYVSDGCQDIYGLPAEDIQRDAQLLIGMIHPAYQESFVTSVAESAATLTPWRWEGAFVLPWGEEKWVQGASRPVRSANGTTTWDGLLMDMTTRKQAEGERDSLLAETQYQRQRLNDLLANVPGVVWEVTGPPDASQLQFVSGYVEQMLGYSLEDWHATSDFWRTIMHPDDYEAVEQATFTTLQSGRGTIVQWRWIAKDGRAIWTETHQRAVFDTHGKPLGLRGVTMDITARREAEAEQQRLQVEITRVQEATLAELSTPLIPISDDVVVMPLIGALDSRRTQQLLETLLAGIQQYRVRTAIIDITGVPVVDTQVANSLIQAAQAVRLLGARVVLTGIRPEVAQTLVGLGVELPNIATESTLQRGIAFALTQHMPYNAAHREKGDRLTRKRVVS